MSDEIPNKLCLEIKNAIILECGIGKSFIKKWKDKYNL